MAARSVLNQALNAALSGESSASRPKQSLTALRRQNATVAAGSDDVAMMEDSAPSGGADRKGRSGSKRHGQGKPYSASDRGRGEKKGKTKEGSAPPVMTDGRGRSVGADKGKGKSEGSDGTGAVDVLRSFLQKRYDPVSRLLNLEDIGSDPFWKETHIPHPLHKKARPTFLPAMWKLCATDLGDVQSISLANNKLQGVLAIAPADLIRFLPRLRNLSLAHNSITRLADIDSLSRDITDMPGRPGLLYLNELILTGNPAAEVPTGNEAKFRHYKDYVAKRFPTLTQLDGIALAPLVTVDPSSAPVAGPSCSQGRRLVFPAQPALGFADTDVVRNTTAQFLLGYLAAFDNDRNSLAHLLSPDSIFSLALDQHASDRASAKGIKPGGADSKKHSLSWDAWQGKSRHLLKKKSKSGKERIFHGSEAIVAAYKALPETSHPLADGDKFVVDSWSLPDVAPGIEAICAVVHGEFTETAKKGLRSFDRTFILIPHPSPTPQAPCLILSDQLTVRSFAGSSAWRPSTDMNGSVPVSQAAPAAAAAPVVVQLAMVQQLRAETKLNEDFARQCLIESQWDYAVALQNFARVRDSIPPAAFQ